jgi:hypothetical protein
MPLKPSTASLLNRLSAGLAVLVVAGSTLFVLSEQPAMQRSALRADLTHIQPLGAIRNLLSRHR